MSFESLGLHPALLSALSKAGFESPTGVQAKAIPQALNGADLIVSAQTGSGKTAAFMLPSVHALAQQIPAERRGIHTLVLTPTRELAQQVAQACKLFCAHLRELRIATVVGGMPYGPQIRALSGHIDVLVATPGRLLDHINADRVKLSNISTLVLDEADRMLDMGFIQDIQAIAKRTPASRQTLMFSATFEKNVAKLAQQMLRNPVRIEVGSAQQKHANIQQSLLFADNAGHKYRLLKHILENDGVYQAIVFSGTKRSADDLARQLSDHGFKSGALHGDMNQRQRSRTIKHLQSGRLQVLVATDVAARGIDVEGITHAINFDMPMQAEDYVHRIGRTGRAGRDGRAYTLATFGERGKIRQIEKFTGQSLETEEIEGLEPIRKSTKPKPAGRSKGSSAKGGKASAAGKPRRAASAPRTSSASAAAGSRQGPLAHEKRERTASSELPLRSGQEARRQPGAGRTAAVAPHREAPFNRGGGRPRSAVPAGKPGKAASKAAAAGRARDILAQVSRSVNSRRRSASHS